jgi:hypothetical protein
LTFPENPATSRLSGFCGIPQKTGKQAQFLHSPAAVNAKRLLKTTGDVRREGKSRADA